MIGLQINMLDYLVKYSLLLFLYKFCYKLHLYMPWSRLQHHFETNGKMLFQMETSPFLW